MAQSFFKITLDNGTTPLILTNNPAGMLDFEIMYKRHKVYGSIFRSIGSNLRFVKEGAEYLKSIFYTYGIDGECSITIKSINLENKTYSYLYEGIIDFSNYLEDADFVEVGVLDNSVMSKFLARENIQVNILDTVNIDGDTITNPVGTPIDLNLSPINPVYWATSDGAQSKITGVTGITANYSITKFPSGDTSPNYLGTDYDGTILKYTNSSGAALTIDFNTKYRTVIRGILRIDSYSGVPGKITFNMDIKRYDTGAVVQNYNEVILSIGSKSLSFDNTITQLISTSIADGDSQGLYTEITVDFDAGVNGEVKYDYVTDFQTYDMQYTDPVYVAPTSCQTVKPLDVGNRILEMIGIDTSVSPFLSTQFGSGGDYEFLELTNGKAIREFPETTPINISFREFFEGYSNMLGLVFYYQSNYFVFSTIDSIYFQGGSGGITINKVSNFKTSIAEDKYFSRIMAGYKDVTYSDIGGNVEFNTGFEYATANKNTNTEINLQSEIRADSIGIEYLRRNTFKKNGLDEKDGDNDLFVIMSKYDSSAGHYRPELGSDFASITGLRASDQYYNFRVSPKSNLQRNAFLLDTTLTYLPSVARYINSKNDIPLIINGVYELDGNYTSGYSIKPIYYEFDTILTDDLMYFLETNPNYVITFYYNGVYNNGFLEEAKVNLYTREVHIKMIKE